MKLSQLLSENSVVGVAGNRSSGKSMLIATQLVETKREHKNIPIYVMGVEQSVEPYLISQGISILRSEMDVLDLQLKDCIIFIDEFATIFDTESKSKQLDKLNRFFDRLEHNNVKLLIGTAREGFWNKYACARITAFYVKEIEYSSLVNGTWLKERVMAIKSLSDYRLECDKPTYYVVTNRGGLTQRYQSEYVKELDTKKDNKNLFRDNTEKDGKNDGE